MKLKLVISLIFLSFLLYAQKSASDSLFIDYVEKYKPLIEKADAKSIKYIDSLAALQEELGSDFTLGLMHQVRAKYWQKKGDQQKTLLNFTASEELLKNCCPDSRAYLESKLGSGFTLIRSGLLNFDTIYFQKGFNVIRQGHQKAKEINDRYNELMTLDFMGDYYYYSAFQKEDMDSALFYYTALEEELAGTPDSTYRFVESKHNLSNVYRRLGKDELSEKYYNRSIELASKYGYNDILFAIFGDKAEVLEEQNRHEETLALRQKAYQYALNTKDPEYINRVDRQLYQSYKSLGQADKALEFLEKYSNGVEEMNKSGALKLQADLEKQLEIDQRELEITQLENKNLQTTKRYLLASALLTLIVLAIMIASYRKLRQKNEALEQKNKEILMAQLKGQNIERKRMAGELHDNLNTKIAAVRFRLEAQKMKAEGQTKHVMNETIDLVNDIYEDIRLISHNLVPETVEELGLVPSLQKLFDSLNENDSTQFHLIAKLTTDKNLRDKSYELYNIIFELINNILKHAKARNAWVSISDYGDKFHVTVRDDGVGFEVDENMGGFGLKSITSRVEKLGGLYRIESNPDMGSKYSIEIPMKYT